MRVGTISSLLQFVIASFGLFLAILAQGQISQHDGDKNLTQLSTSAGSKIQYLVVASDTLWNISERLKPKNLSVWQAMDGLYRANSPAFLDNDPSKIIVGSIIDIPAEKFIQDQSGLLIARMLDLQVYKKAVSAGARKSDESHQDLPALEQRQHEIDRKIPYYDVGDLALMSETSESHVAQSNDPFDESLTQIKERELTERIDALSSQVEVLEAMLIAEREVKVQALAEVKRLDDKPFKKSWIDYVESKITLALILLSLLSILVLARGRALKPDNFGNGAVERITDDAFNGVIGEEEGKTTSEYGDLVEADGFEFTDDFSSEFSEDLDYLDSTENINPVDVKLDLAETYADLGDIAGAREILEEIISESNKEGKIRATAVLEKLNAGSQDQ